MDERLRKRLSEEPDDRLVTLELVADLMNTGVYQLRSDLDRVGADWDWQKHAISIGELRRLGIVYSRANSSVDRAKDF